MNSLAPIVIFTYNRPKNLSELLNSLQDNDLANNSIVYFFVDFPKNIKDKNANDEVLKIVNRSWKFKEKYIVLRKENLGIRDNIVDGVSTILKNYEKIIVLEEDLVVGKYFLEFMNTALTKFKNQSNVWHISGYNYKVNNPFGNSSFLTKHMSCWGWGTWRENWLCLDKNMLNNINIEQIKEFNFNNLIKSNYEQLHSNQVGKIKTWAIFWQQTIFLNKGYCLMPTRSLVVNTGFESGEHGSKTMKNNFKTNNMKIKYFPKTYRENNLNNLLLKFYFLKLKTLDYIKYHLKKLIK